MRRRTPNVGQVKIVLLTFAVFLAACGSITAPGCSTANVSGNFSGPVPGLPNVDITLRAHGNTLEAFTSDGDAQASPPRPPMINEWFTSPVTNNQVDVMATPSESSPIPAHLVASWDMHAASGTLAFQGGRYIHRSFHFKVEEVGDPPIHPGLYRAEKGVDLAGWVVLSSQQQREGIINEQTGELLIAPALTAQDIASGQVTVPGLGVFILTLFPLGQPTQITVTPTTPQITITPTTPVPTPVVNFIATLNPSSVNCPQAPGQSNLLLDNTGNNVDVNWALRFQEMDPYSKTNYWGSASSNNGTVPAGQQGTVVITPSSDLCQATARTYHLQVSYTPTGLPQQSPIVLDYTVVV